MAANQKMKSILRVLAWVLPPVFLYLCFREVDWQALAATFSRIHLLHLFVALGFILAIPWLKAFQWQTLFRPGYVIPFFKLFETVSVWIMATNIFPLWAGEAMTVFVLSKKEGVPKSAALSVLVLDRIFDGITLVLFVLALAWAGAVPLMMRQSLWGVLVFVVLAIVALALLSYKFRHRPQGSQGIFKGAFARWAHELQTLRNLQNFFLVLVWTLVARAMEYFSLIFLQWGFGLDLPWYAPLLVMTALHVAMIIPAVPGNLGIFEAAVFFVYRFLGVEPSVALGMALLFHALLALPLIIQGYGFYLRLGLRRASVNKMENSGFPADQIIPGGI